MEGKKDVGDWDMTSGVSAMSRCIYSTYHELHRSKLSPLEKYFNCLKSQRHLTLHG